jgi:hypothetical protein
MPSKPPERGTRKSTPALAGNAGLSGLRSSSPSSIAG